ncbi:hypothetical protein KCU83_g402, partial [Aureobasidium melanogenum]
MGTKRAIGSSSRKEENDIFVPREANACVTILLKGLELMVRTPGSETTRPRHKREAVDFLVRMMFCRQCVFHVGRTTNDPWISLVIATVQWHERHLGSGLLVKVGLNTTLLSLALIVLGLVLGLVGLIASNASNSTTDGARNTVGDTRTQVVELALGLLLLALLVLLSTLLFQGLVAHEVAESLLAGAQDAVATDVGPGVRGVVLEIGFGLLVLASGLSLCERLGAQSRLSGARGRVDVRLESGGVLVRHVWLGPYDFTDPFDMYDMDPSRTCHLLTTRWSTTGKHGWNPNICVLSRFLGREQSDYFEIDGIYLFTHTKRLSIVASLLRRSQLVLLCFAPSSYRYLSVKPPIRCAF